MRVLEALTTEAIAFAATTIALYALLAVAPLDRKPPAVRRVAPALERAPEPPSDPCKGFTDDDCQAITCREIRRRRGRI